MNHNKFIEQEKAEFKELIGEDFEERGVKYPAVERWFTATIIQAIENYRDSVRVDEKERECKVCKNKDCVNHSDSNDNYIHNEALQEIAAKDKAYWNET